MSDLALSAIRGAALTFTGDPFSEPSDSAIRYERDSILVMEDGLITEFGDAETLLPTLWDGVEIPTYNDSLHKASRLSRRQSCADHSEVGIDNR